MKEAELAADDLEMPHLWMLTTRWVSMTVLLYVLNASLDIFRHSCVTETHWNAEP